MSQGSAPALKPTAKTVIEHAFAGRIPVLRPDFMSDEQKQVYDRINGSQVPWAANAGFRVKADDGGLLGPYNSQLLSPGTETQRRSTRR